MPTLILSQMEIRSLLPMSTCIELIAEALSAISRGDGQNPLRHMFALAGTRNVIGLMPGNLRSPPALGLKVVSVFPGNHAAGLDSHQGVVVLFDPENGTPRCILDASEITAIRTAAASAVATRALAREDAHDLAILGAGVEARTHLEAMCAVRKIRRARVFSRTREKREAFAARESKRHGVPVEAVDSAFAAVEGADIVCTTTSSRTPVLEGAWLAPGAHVNAVGACFKDGRELDTSAVVRARLFVDRRESTLAESGDFLIPKAEGAVGDDHIQGEIGEVLNGARPGRRSRDEITLYKSLGIAIEDLATARWLDERAREQKVGVHVDFKGRGA